MAIIEQLIKENYLKTSEIIEAFKKIKRADFVRIEDRGQAEANTPLNIGYGQTISQPLSAAFMIELLAPKPGEKILDVGSGSGWTAALLAQIVGVKGRVYGVERICQLKDFAVANISKYNFIKSGIVQIFCANGYNGLPEAMPFDNIIVAAAAEDIPKTLLRQLKIGGRLVLPIGRQYESQSIVVVEKIGNINYKQKEYPGFIFVPLINN